MADVAAPDRSREWITIATLTDPVEAEMLEELFHHEGIPVAMAGKQHRAMLGVLGGYVSILVQIPLSERERAVELLSAFRTTPSEPKSTPDQTAAPSTPRRSPKAAAGVAMLGVAVLASVGAGHLYMRQNLAAASLFVLGWTAILTLLRGGETWPAIPLLVLIDMIGAARAATVQARGELVRSTKHSLAVVVVALTALALSPMVAGFLSYHFPEHLPNPHLPNLRRNTNPDWDGRTR